MPGFLPVGRAADGGGSGPAQAPASSGTSLGSRRRSGSAFACHRPAWGRRRLRSSCGSAAGLSCSETTPARPAGTERPPPPRPRRGPAGGGRPAARPPARPSHLDPGLGDVGEAGELLPQGDAGVGLLLEGADQQLQLGLAEGGPLPTAALPPRAGGGGTCPGLACGERRSAAAAAGRAPLLLPRRHRQPALPSPAPAPAAAAPPGRLTGGAGAGGEAGELHAGRGLRAMGRHRPLLAL